MDSIDPMLFYARKDDVKDDMHNLMDALKRLEDKLDKILMGSR
jgi:hypothetical protein